MKYKQGIGFIMRSDEFKLFEEGSNHHELERILSPLTFWLIRIKAIQEYLSKEGHVKSLSARRDYQKQLEKLGTVYEQIGILESSISYENVVNLWNSKRFLPQHLQIESMSLEGVTQEDLIRAWKDGNADLIVRLCAGAL